MVSGVGSVFFVDWGVTVNNVTDLKRDVRYLGIRLNAITVVERRGVCSFEIFLKHCFNMLELDIRRPLMGTSKSDVAVGCHHHAVKVVTGSST